MSSVSSQMPIILCCICATPIVANAANTCVSCLKSQVDVTEGIPKEVIIHQCRGCMRWLRPPWVTADLESRELLAMCLKKINNLNRIKLIDANWVWTEPHSRRLKLKLTVQKEVMSKMIMQQSFVVTFVVRNQQCDTCQASFANQSWRAVVQARQRVDHKRTFFFLEQLILKHRAHEKTTNIESQPDGVDFFFSERNHALRFVDFLQESIPMKLKTAKKLISADNHSNTHNYKFTYAVEIVPVCKDDLVVLPIKLARMLGNMSCLCLVQSVTSSIHVIDPFTTQVAEIDSEKYWRYPFRGLRSTKTMTDFTVLNTTPMAIPTRGGRPIRVTRKTRLAEMEIVRNADFGVNDTRLSTLSHLGMILHVGDFVRGYDLSSAVFNDSDLAPLAQSGMSLPDVVLVKKTFPRRTQKRARNWKLKKMEGVNQVDSVCKTDLLKVEQDYEQFLDDLEEDKEMRSQINLYKDETKQTTETNAMEEDDVAAPTVELHELLDDMTMKEDQWTSQVISETEAKQTLTWELEEL
ncbi:unnamed protein product [Peronospora belbahrii]|uniref:60S ribosomal export protein NMD3 n=1 Tax=Peronospora belbahrii TaxID=622444 RepID=A0AAU9LQL1_9STRA|nr:unnamed protein product [Peronospora belbahrii]